MKICLVGHYVDQPDEGVRKITHQLARELSLRHELCKVDIADVKSWPSIGAFRPEVIHFVLSPTLLGLAVAKVISLTCRSPVTVVSAPHPHVRHARRLASLLRPDLMLVQAEDSEREFRCLGYRTQFLANGVDTERFVPADDLTKQRLREKHGIQKDRFVILHVGSLKRGRNLRVMRALQGDNNQVFVVGRASDKEDRQLVQELRESGWIVRTQYVPNIEEAYALSDCYVFPTTDRRYCIEMPLSILEAMSCNLPVITTRFGALPRVLQEGSGFRFFDHVDDLVKVLRSLRQESPTRTREKSLEYSWANAGRKLIEIYQELTGSSHISVPGYGPGETEQEPVQTDRREGS